MTSQLIVSDDDVPKSVLSSVSSPKVSLLISKQHNLKLLHFDLYNIFMMLYTKAILAPTKKVQKNSDSIYCNYFFT
jgi:hypothetical protein